MFPFSIPVVPFLSGIVPFPIVLFPIVPFPKVLLPIVPFPMVQFPKVPLPINIVPNYLLTKNYFQSPMTHPSGSLGLSTKIIHEKKKKASLNFSLQN